MGARDLAATVRERDLARDAYHAACAREDALKVRIAALVKQAEDAQVEAAAANDRWRAACEGIVRAEVVARDNLDDCNEQTERAVRAEEALRQIADAGAFDPRVGWAGDECARVARKALAAAGADTPEEACGSFGCTLPKGHNRGRADVPENHRAAAGSDTETDG